MQHMQRASARIVVQAGGSAVLLDIAAVLPVQNMAKPPGPDNPGFVFPHPPWEQHAMFAQQIALRLAGFADAAACRRPQAHSEAVSATPRNADTAGRSGECAPPSLRFVDVADTPSAAIQQADGDVRADGSRDCDGAESAWFEARSAMRSRTKGWTWVQSTGQPGTVGDAKPLHPSVTAASVTAGPAGRSADPRGAPGATELAAWALFEDRPGKPGWILNSTGTPDHPGHNLTFILADPWWVDLLSLCAALCTCRAPCRHAW